MSGTQDDPAKAPSSPVCYAGEPEANPLGPDAIVALLNELLEGERAGARCAPGAACRVAALPRIADAELVAELDEMYQVRVANIRRYAELAAELRRHAAD